MRSRRRFIIWATVGVVGSTALAIAVNVATGSSISEWSNAASIVSAVVAILGILAAIISTFFTARTTNAEDEARRVQEQLAFRLIRTFAAIEKEVSYQQTNQAASPRPLSLREVEVIMADSGVWDDQDQIGFDLATRVRNSIVHGDLDQVDPPDLRYANEKAEQLLKKVQGAGRAG
jgi:hypothetical protein